MPIVSVDLAMKSYADIGVAVLESTGGGISARFPRLSEDPKAHPTTDLLADLLIGLCKETGARQLLVDGPQAWKSETSEPVHSRVGERALNAPAKTGLPRTVKPRAYTRFVEFSIELFDALSERGWPRLMNTDAPLAGDVAIETLPVRVWDRLRLERLRAKATCRPFDVAAACDRLCHAQRITLAPRAPREPTHDQLQALAAGVAGIALERGDRSCYALVGAPPERCDGLWREGFILVPQTGMELDGEA